MKNEILIRNVDASYLYWKIMDGELIAEYDKTKKNLSEDKKDQELQLKVEELAKQIFSFKKNIELPCNDNRYLYSGTLPYSLMSEKLREVVAAGEIRTVADVDYTDVIINIKFKSDFMRQTDDNKKRFNPDTEEIEVLEEKKSKVLMSGKKLRKIAFRDGVTINGVHYVQLQRTSSKARVGSCLFIDERYFDEMEEWQTLNIPFREIFGADTKEKIDIVSTRSYESLTSSSIIGTLDIDPYSILLIDEADGTAVEPCNVVTLNEKTKRLQVQRKDYEKHIDLWDGQSLGDESLFKEGTYTDRNGKVHTYEKKGFVLTRNHFFKSAIFNTKLQEYYKEVFANVENPIIKDRFGNEYNPFDIKVVTTKNSVKILKFADVITKYMIADDKKEKLNELLSEVQLLEEEITTINNRVTTAKKYLTIARKKDGNITAAEKELELATADQEKRLPELEAEIKKLNKPIKFEQERLTWDWYREELKNQKQLFGVCKYEKTSKFGDRQQLWYQVLGSLNLNEEQLWQIVEPQVNEINLMKKYPAFLTHNLNITASESDNIGSRLMKELLQVNEDITRTQWYTNFRRTYINSILDGLFEGKIQLNNSDFCTLIANPYEMLRASIGEKIDSSILSDFQCYCNRYADGEELYGFRSPHIAIGENALLKNTYRPEWKWFNFTDRILIINLFGKGAFLSDIWQGSDQDSDVAYIGNDLTILEATKETVTSGKYLVPINGLEPENDPKQYTNEMMAKVDGKLANDLIGKVCNLARDLQCFYWHLYNTGTEENKEKYLPQIYDDICILAVASGIAIDSAKRLYKDVSLETELKEIKKRPYLQVKGVVLNDSGAFHVERRYKKILSDEVIVKYEDLQKQRELATTKEEINQITKRIDELLMKEDITMIRPDFTKKLKAKPKKKKHFKNDEERNLYNEKKRLAAEERKQLEEKIYVELECSMDRLKRVIMEHLERADRTKMITFVELLNPIPKGFKADYKKIEAIKKIGIEGNEKLNQIYAKYHAGKISYDEMYEQKQITIQNILNNIRYSDADMTKERKLSPWDIQKIIRDVYDTHPEKNNHGKPKKVNGKLVIVDKRDKRLIGDRNKNCVGQKLLQWLYEVYQEEFMTVIKHNVGYITYLQEVKESGSIKNLKDLKEWSDTKDVYELYGKKYKIRKRLAS